MQLSRQLILLLLMVSAISAATVQVWDENNYPVVGAKVELQGEGIVAYTDSLGIATVGSEPLAVHPHTQKSKSSISLIGGNISITSDVFQKAKLYISNMRGQVLFSYENTLPSGMTVLPTETLAAGVYLLQGTIGTNSVTQKFRSGSNENSASLEFRSFTNLAPVNSDDGVVTISKDWYQTHSVQVNHSIDMIYKITLKSSQTPVQQFGDLQVMGTHLCDERGKPIQLRGMSTHGIQYFSNMYTENLVRSLSTEWNADIIRISSYINEGFPNPGGYLKSPEHWHNYIDQLVDYAEQEEIYVLIDWHMLSPGDPNYYLEEAKSFFYYMAEKHGAKDNVLFEICNEPNNQGLYKWDIDNGNIYISDTLVPGKTVTWNENIKPYAEEILPIIRQHSDNIVIVGTPQWSSRPDRVVGNMLGYKNIMYAMHFYAASHGSSYHSFVEYAVEREVPIFITEFGIQEASGDGENDYYSASKWLDLLEREKISWINWNLSQDHRSSAVYLRDASLGSVESYADRTNMNDGGKWVLDKIQNR